jgi:hypothetical protein
MTRNSRWMGSEARHNANLFRIERSLLAGQMSADYCRAVPTLDLPDDELAALTKAIRRLIAEDKYPRAPRLDPLRAALARLDAATATEPVPPAKAKPAGQGEKSGRR